ncbi:hypothetical protein HK405_007987 [Cladochytrium tenue]|nr:hypothetical protein HK405_007987 [Cladochytrium tenue]
MDDLPKNTKNNGKKKGSSKSDGNESRQNDERPDDSNREETEKLSSSKKPGKPRKKVLGNEVDEGSDEQNQPNVENLRSKKAYKKKGGKGGKKLKSKKSTLAKKNIDAKSMDDENNYKSNADDGKDSNDGGEKVENFPGDSRTQKKAEKKSGRGGSSELGDDASGDGDKEPGENKVDSDEHIENKPKRSPKKSHSKQKSTNGAKKHAKKSNDDGVSTDGEQSDPPSSPLNEDEVDEGTESKDVGGPKQSPNGSHSGQKSTKTGAKKLSKKNMDEGIPSDGDQSKSPSNLKPKGSQPQKAGFRYVDLYARGLRKTGGRRYSAAYDNVIDDGNLHSGDNFDSYGDRNELQGDDLDADDALIADHILSGSKLSAIDDEMYDESDFGDENELDSIDSIEDDDYLIAGHIIAENGAEALEDSSYAEDNLRSWSKSAFSEDDFVDALASEEDLDDDDAAFEDDFEDEDLGEDNFDDDDADVDDALDDDDLDDDETIDELDDEYIAGDFFESDEALEDADSAVDESELSGSDHEEFAADSFEVDEASTSSSSADLIDGASSSVYAEIPDPQVRKLTPFKIVAGIYFIASGIMLLVFGHRLFKPVLFVSGFNFTALVILAIVSAISNRTGNYYSDSVYFFSAFVTGLLGGVLFICFWRAGVFTVGALLGYAISTVILSFVSNGTIPSAVGRGAFIIALALAFGIAILFFERYLLIPATAVPGALSVVLGIDMYTQFGLVDAQRSFLSGLGGFSTSGRYWGLLAAFFVLAAIGCAVQAVLANRSRSKGANATATAAGSGAVVTAAGGASGLAASSAAGAGAGDEHGRLPEDLEKFQIGDESAALLGDHPGARKM